jgi:hypothetical protein
MQKGVSVHPPSSALPNTDFLCKLRVALTKDKVTAELLKTVSKDDPAYRCINGLLYLLEDRRYRLYIPNDSELKSLLLRDFHETPSAGHPGVQRTCDALKMHFYWPHLFEDVRACIASCRHCQLVKPATMHVEARNNASPQGSIFLPRRA